uniref:Uncharacterized protein n=1 Tax=Solanum lycopersicum TaxID=4081 RepID=A0A3Q7EF67_SOLLC
MAAIQFTKTATLVLAGSVCDTSKIHNCIPDEHYGQTLLAHVGLECEITWRTVTHTAWVILSSKEHHGKDDKLSNVTPMLI